MAYYDSMDGGGCDEGDVLYSAVRQRTRTMLRRWNCEQKDGSKTLGCVGCPKEGLKPQVTAYKAIYCTRHFG